MSPREARVLALQVLYEADVASHDAWEVLKRWLSEEALDQETEHFVSRLIGGVIERQSELDAIIQRHAPQFPVEQLAPIDRNIMRMALFEITSGITPLKVAINEAVELAKQFGSDSSPHFVNGVLGAAVRT
ncbi:MAG: transcription antitermination factor NusB [Thermoflexales bacterium]